jgi:hypothetical protein
MIIDLFHPFKDDLSQHFQGDFQSSLGSCDANPFGDADLFYDEFQPPSSLILDEHQDIPIPEESRAHSTKQKYFHIGDFYEDSQMKRQCFSIHEHVPYLISSSHRNHGVFLGSLMSSQSSGSENHANGDEYDPSSTYDSLIHIWINQACGFSFQQDFLPPTHLHEFHFMIDCISIYAHDHYVLEFSLLYYMNKHRGGYLDKMINWLHWLYNFT